MTSRYAWVYGGYPYYNTPDSGSAHRYFDEMRLLLGETLSAGTTVRLQKDAGDTAAYYIIDFIECEMVAAPLTQPAGSLSVSDFGAVPNDDQDDHDAFVKAIAAAEEQGKELWIPAGIFDLVEMSPLEVTAVTIRGAGMWHTNLRGAGAAFKFTGTCKFYDFAMTGVSTIRDDAGEPAGFENGGRNTNVTIQNIWMEHMKVGVWTANSAHMAIQGCRIRNTYADGINLCSGVTDSVVRNNSLRNTGDDCIAIWPWLANSTGNTITHNTIQIPTLANGVAIYGGGNNVADSNYIADIINNGAGIVVGSEFETPNGFTGPITVKDNVLDRCGSMQTDEDYMIGAIWIWNSFHHAMNTATIAVSGNKMKDCSQVGITIEHNMDELTGVDIQDNSVNGAKHAVFSYLSGGGYGSIKRLTQENITGEPFVYAASQGDEVKAMTSYEEGSKAFLKGADSAFVLEIQDSSGKYFTDVPATSWAADAVAFVVAHGLIDCTSETQFSPDLPMKYGMLAEVLGKLEGSPDSSISDYSDSQFAPNDNITREQLAVMLWCCAGNPAANQSLDFNDADQASSYALDALCWATENGIMNGKGGGILDPQGTASRAETAQMLMNYLTK